MNSVDTTPMTLFLFVFELRFFLAAVGFLLIPFERNFEIDGLYTLVSIRKLRMKTSYKDDKFCLPKLRI